MLRSVELQPGNRGVPHQPRPAARRARPHRREHRRVRARARARAGISAGAPRARSTRRAHRPLRARRSAARDDSIALERTATRRHGPRSALRCTGWADIPKHARPSSAAWRSRPDYGATRYALASTLVRARARRRGAGPSGRRRQPGRSASRARDDACARPDAAGPVRRGRIAAHAARRHSARGPSSRTSCSPSCAIPAATPTSRKRSSRQRAQPRLRRRSARPMRTSCGSRVSTALPKRCCAS